MRCVAALQGVVAVAAGLGALALPAAAENRTIDGSGNNLANPTWGAAGIDLLRMAPPAYADGVWMPAGPSRPSARHISNLLSAQSASVPDERSLSSMAWQWGQFIDHDIDLTDTQGAGGETMPIPVPTGDPFFDPMATGTANIQFSRSVFNPATGLGPGNPRQQPNAITAFIDGSMVYGSDATRAAALRAGVGGRLAVTPHATGDLLPFNTAGLPNAGGTGANLFLAGDVRANEQAGLTAMHTLFVREHNHWADQIAAANPTWSDEQVYQRARKIVGAEIQAITYNEWLPALLGGAALPAYTGYDPTVNPSIATEFSTAAFRVGHTMLNESLLRFDAATGAPLAQGHLALADAFFRPDRITDEGGVDPILQGLYRQSAERIDTMVVDAVRNFLFGPPGAGGFDLAALNIQRGRDHGLPDYNTLRQAVLGPGAAITSFADITSDVAIQTALQAAYSSVDDIDPWIGMLAEDHVPGASVGETILAILVDQFTRLRDGDRFFYLNDPDFTEAEKALLDGTTLADILRRNTAIAFVPDNVFVVPGPGAASLLLLGGGAAATARRRRPR